MQNQGAGRRVFGPERPRGQGLGPHQTESGDRAILSLLCDPEVEGQVDLVMTWRQPPEDGEGDGAYEVWARRGMVRFRRFIDDRGELDYPVLEVVGENPLARQEIDALRSIDEEREAARRTPVPGADPDDPNRRYIAAREQSYPFAYERVAQLFDSPHAPDLVISPHDWTFGTQVGTHGALNVRQSRVPLWLAGPRVRPGVYDLPARSVDLAPTALAALDFPLIDGADATGRPASQRGAAPDVYLRRQDGRVLEEILDRAQDPARYLYLFLLDGIHFTELEERLRRDPEALPGLRRLHRRAAVMGCGAIVNFPSITWPSHTAIGTGTWCGHHDVVNPSYYLRETREAVSPQGQQLRTEGFSSLEVESLFEAFERVRGPQVLTAAIYAPFGRGASHASLEGRNLCDRPRLHRLNDELSVDRDPRWLKGENQEVANESVLDTRGMAQVVELFTREDREGPDFVYHELIITDGAGHYFGPHDPGLRTALDESDRRVSRVLDLLEDAGRLDQTCFIVAADHGMSPQNTSLRANPARHVKRIGMQCVVAEPMVWLLDLAVWVRRAADGRTARVRVLENDAGPTGDRPAVEGAEVIVTLERRGYGDSHGDGQGHGKPSEELARGRSGPDGVFGFATPADVDSAEIVVTVSAEGFNPRRLIPGAGPLALDLCQALYGRDPR